MPVKKPYKFSKPPLDSELQQLFRETEDNFVSLDADGNIVIDKDISCRSIFVESDSLYIGGVKLGKPAFDEDGYYLKYDRATSKFTYNQKAIPIDEDVQDIAGAMFSGNTETFITATYQDADGTIDLVVPVKDEDDMASNSNAHLPTQQSAKAYTENTAIAMAVALGMP
jgi:hypothetical protein